ncbi:TniQ family protein [Paenibacillus tyrfis]|uniref:TniQ family protein n=1 Tax=Paenibacillus tyrfis TaxID=1501230 RepID=UPI000B594FC6|nr:TniQ family protein [Paenibacillus tyrfis]
MSMYVPFPKRPKIFQDESQSGYLFRLFKANHFVPNTAFLRESNITYSQLINNEISGQAMMGMVPWISSINNTYRIQGTANYTWYNKLIQKNNLKYCPICIQEKYYHRNEWCILPLKVCLKHHVILQEGCPICNKPIQFYEFIEQRCKHCFYPLIQTRRDYVKNDIINDSQSMLVRVLIHNEKSNLFGLQAIDYLELVFASFLFLNGSTDFTGYSNETIDAFYNRKNKMKSSLNFAVAFSNVDWTYSNFPKHFLQVLDLFLLKTRGMKRYSAFQKFERLVSRDCYSVLREAFQFYCLQKLETGLIRKDFGVFRNEPELLKKRKVIRREEVKLEKGVTYGKLLRLSKNNMVLLESRKNNEYYVDRITLETYLEEEKKWISKKEASLILGIHFASIENLIKNNLLQASTSYSGNFKRLNIEEVISFMERCSGKLVESIPANHISFHDALLKYSVNNMTIISILQFILSDKLRPVRLISRATLKDLFMNHDELSQCLMELRIEKLKEHGYYFTDLLKILKIGEKRLRRLLDSHDIHPDFVIYHKDGRTRSLYKKTTVERIREVLISALDGERRECRIGNS